MLKSKGPFLLMVLSVVGVVLWVTLFSSILDALVALAGTDNISTFTALTTIIKISAVVLLLGGVFAAGFGYYQGYKGAGASDASGIMRMVLGVIFIILFVTLFATIVTGFYTLYSHANASYFTAFTTVTAIAPTVLFLGGIFAGGATAVSGARSWRRRRRSYLR